MGIFDIETLGLSPQFAPLILAGFMTVEKDGSCWITQYFAETPGDERYILEYLRDDFDRVDYLLTSFCAQACRKAVCAKSRLRHI